MGFTVRRGGGLQLASSATISSDSAPSTAGATGGVLLSANTASWSLHSTPSLHALCRKSKQRRAYASPRFASLTTLWANVSGTGDIRKLWNDIDSDRNGYVSAEDLTVYAKANGLPASYVKQFVQAVMNVEHMHAEQEAAAAAQLQQQQQLYPYPTPSPSP